MLISDRWGSRLWLVPKYSVAGGNARTAKSRRGGILIRWTLSLIHRGTGFATLIHIMQKHSRTKKKSRNGPQWIRTSAERGTPSYICYIPVFFAKFSGPSGISDS